MKEFVFLKDYDVDAVLSDDIDVITSIEEERALVSNSSKQNTEVYAPEINFYLKHSKDNILDKAKNVSILYEARAHCFDQARDIDYQKEIGRNVILISDNNKDELIKDLKEAEYKVIHLNHNEVKFLYGEIGDLFVTILRENDEIEVEADFVLVDGIKDYMLRQSGTLDITHFLNDEVIEYLNQRSPIHKYKSAITYDSTICQYHERRTEHCSKCVDVCPTVAILKDDEVKRHLVFSHIDCIECGGCISVCPSGALDYAKMPRNAFYEIAKMYEDKKIVITPRIMDIENCDVELPEGVLPFAIEGEKFLSETHFMTLLQSSGANVIYYSDIMAPGVKESISLVNQIMQAKFGVDGVLVAEDEIELRRALQNSKFIVGLKYEMSEYATPKREIFAKRVAHIVGNDDLGVAKSGDWVRYGKVEIFENNCTLCLSCVGACNVGALVADKTNNSIKFNASICTTCGYCEASCAEKDAIKLTRGEMRLEPTYFEHQELVKDTLFACIECGKEFATSKAVTKIATMMTPFFEGDPHKMKTLYCCADCKAKIMVQKQLEETRKFKEELK
ncbi:[4Fe-4S] dicluster domain-containing protein [Campylobacter blaseri]|uniref:Ferredoxin n=1 Tax=Campylobacter blaseri TaxID=2042961 RepID=A0A2P8R462_9BACT|nr:4Fe-4S dicluster domain-containing protein [Campylobacter blaseri]PSM53263.1 ferredoxin [Campylobacter blaseri]PSM54729.1 ferredoxin [Campylobacter blaseri]QKF86788.1 [4Fe-4S] dicluster domain-containing protein [Campylobacter blaseri]